MMQSKTTRGDWWTDNKVHLEEINFRGPFVEVYSRGIIGDNLPAITAGGTPEEAQANAALIVSAKKLHHAADMFCDAMAERNECRAPGCTPESPCKLCDAYYYTSNVLYKMNHANHQTKGNENEDNQQAGSKSAGRSG